MMGLPGVVIGLSITFAVAEPSMHGEPPIRADPEVQALIDQAAAAAVNAKSRLEAWAEVEKLAAIEEDSPEELLRQLLYYWANEANDPERRLYSGTISWYFHIPDARILQVGIPYLYTEHEPLRGEVRGMFRNVENGSAGQAMDFSRYQSLISRSRDDPPLALIRYMYERSPAMALLSLMRVYLPSNRVETREAQKPFLWAEHVVSDVLWKHRHRFLDKNELPGEAAAELEKLSKHEAWWARLYVAEIFRQHPQFRRPEVVERLAADEHALVRQAMSFANPQEKKR